VWLLLVEQLGKLREPAALPGWLATTTKRECLRVVTAGHRSDRLTSLDDTLQFVDDVVIDEEILMAERNAGCARPWPSSRPVQAVDLHAPARPALFIFGDQRNAADRDGKHRSAASPLLERLRQSDALIALGAGERTINIREAARCLTAGR